MDASIETHSRMRFANFANVGADTLSRRARGAATGPTTQRGHGRVRVRGNRTGIGVLMPTVAATVIASRTVAVAAFIGRGIAKARYLKGAVFMGTGLGSEVLVGRMFVACGT